MCSSPRNPQRKPKPSAAEVSGMYASAASLSCNLPMEALSFSYSEVSIGYIPEKTMGLTSLYPASISAAGLPVSVMVSPILTLETSLIFVTIYPVQPASSDGSGVMDGVNRPTSLTDVLRPPPISRISSPAFIEPENTRT